MKGEGGFFTTPNYPSPYPTNTTCVWTIVTAPGDTIELKFEEFHLENSGDCLFDYVDIRDGRSLISPLIGRFCSSQIIAPINSPGNSLLVRFKSDSNVSEKGFRASWRRVSHGISTTRVSNTPVPSTGTPSTRATTTRRASTTLTTTTPVNGK